MTVEVGLIDNIDSIATIDMVGRIDSNDRDDKDGIVSAMTTTSLVLWHRWCYDNAVSAITSLAL